MISDRAMGMFELSNDLLYQKIPVNKRCYYVEEALKIGRETAEKVAQAQEKTYIFQMYQNLGIEIIYQEKSQKNYGVSFRAQSEFCSDGSATVLLYRGSIAELALCSVIESAFAVDEKLATKIHLAHEFFHYLEYNSSELKNGKTMEYYVNGFVSEYLDTIELFSLFGRKRKAGILRSSEIAAHAFAKELLGIPILPNYYDYLYLMKCGKIQKDEFLAQASQYEK